MLSKWSQLNAEQTLVTLIRSWASSVSIVSDYRLDDRGSTPGEANYFFSSLCVQTGLEAQPSSCTMGTGGPFPGGKARQGRNADHSLHLLPMLRMSRSCTSTPWRLQGVVSGTALFCFNTFLKNRQRAFRCIGDIKALNSMAMKTKSNL
jgi:hypothetical protein